MSTTGGSERGKRPERIQIMRGRLTRSTDDRMVAGLAGGIAARLGVPTVFVRAAFLALALAGGVGLLCYLVGWVITPDEQQYGSLMRPDEPATTTQRLGLLLGFLAVLVALDGIGLWFGPIVWPSVLFLFGAALVWDRSSTESRERMARFARPTEGGHVRSRVQIFVGAALMVVGVVVVLASLRSFQSMGPVAIAVLLTAAGFMMLFGPWVWGLFEDLSDERTARIRSEERGQMAVHLHDSVLQTLAMIQRTDDPQRMITLARAQERDLRAWLFDPGDRSVEGTVGEAIATAAAKVEAAFDIPIEVVVVGDRELDDEARPLIAAASEAMANAAKHSGARTVAVYIECSNSLVEGWITDQGSGFDLDAVSPDRKGISESIVARMARSGGEATVISRKGEGTEVHLRSECR